MAAKGYCTTSDIEAITGDLTAAQLARATQLIETAETYLDGRIGRGWLEGVQTQEAHYKSSQYVLLYYFPVASVDTVYGRTDLGETETTLVADTDYEVRDLAAGIVRIVSPGTYDRIRVTYTPENTVPADVGQACAELAAQWLQPMLRPGTFGLDSYSLPDLTVRFARSHVQAAAAPFVESVIEKYRVPVTE